MNAAAAEPAVSEQAPLIDAVDVADAAPKPPVLIASAVKPAAATVTTSGSSRCAGKIGTTRTLRLDTTGGPKYGVFNKYPPLTGLGPKEVILTFDDGPNPRATGKILNILAEHCVKATFFVVGGMARAHKGLLRRIAAEGHTLAGHTANHPMPFGKLEYRKGVREIERGFEMVNAALGAPIAPIFRFPGLSDHPRFLSYLQGRDISALSVDVVAGDTRQNATSASVTRNVLNGVRRKGGGIVLMHDPLNRTARALPRILKGLQEGGYKIVHLAATRPFVSADGSAPEAAPDALDANRPVARAPRRPIPKAFETKTLPAIY